MLALVLGLVLCPTVAVEGDREGACRASTRLDLPSIRGACLRNLISSKNWYSFGSDVSISEDPCYGKLHLSDTHPNPGEWSEVELRSGGGSEVERDGVVEVGHCEHGYIYRFAEAPECGSELCFTSPHERERRDAEENLSTSPTTPTTQTSPTSSSVTSVTANVTEAAESNVTSPVSSTETVQTTPTPTVTTTPTSATSPGNVTSAAVSNSTATTSADSRTTTSATATSTPTSFTSAGPTEQGNQTSSSMTSSSMTISEGATSASSPTATSTPTSFTSGATSEQGNQTSSSMTSSSMTTSEGATSVSSPTATSTPTSFTSGATSEQQNQTSSSMTSSSMTTSEGATSSSSQTPTSTPTSATSPLTSEQVSSSTMTASRSSGSSPTPASSSATTTPTSPTSSFTSRQPTTSSSLATSPETVTSPEPTPTTTPTSYTSSANTGNRSSTGPTSPSSQSSEYATTATPTITTSPSSATTKDSDGDDGPTREPLTAPALTSGAGTNFLNGSSVRLTCVVTRVRSEITWYLNGEEIAEGNPSYDQDLRWTTTTRGFLSFTAETNFTGDYHCRSNGLDSNTLYIAVLDFKSGGGTVTVESGLYGNVTCWVYDNNGNTTFLGEEWSGTSTLLRSDGDWDLYQYKVLMVAEGQFVCKSYYEDMMVSHYVYNFLEMDISYNYTFEFSLELVTVGARLNVTCYAVTPELVRYTVGGRGVAREEQNITNMGIETVDGVRYTMLLWDIGPVEKYSTNYTCSSFEENEVVYRVTTQVGGYTLSPGKPLHVADSAESNVTCSYDGPVPASITWSRDGTQIAVDDDLSGGDELRNDSTLITGLSTATTLTNITCTYLIADYNTTHSTSFYFTYAEIPDLAPVQTYYSDTVNTTCEYSGADSVTLTWYNSSGYEMVEGGNTSLTLTTDTGTQSLVLAFTGHGYQGGSFTCRVQFTDTGGLGVTDTTKLYRTGFLKSLPSMVITEASEFNLVCIWGSSDRPDEAKWLIDGLPPFFPMFTAESSLVSEYVMRSTVDVLVQDYTEEEWTCIFTDEAGTTVNSSTMVYGVSVTVDESPVAISSTSNTTVCTVNRPSSDMWWEFDGERLTSNETLNITAPDNTTLSLEFLDIDSDLDGEYICYAVVLNETFSGNITVSHTDVEIIGPSTVIVTESTHTLNCTVDTNGEISAIRWFLGDRRIPGASDLVYEAPVETHALLTSATLDYTCMVVNEYGRFSDSVTILLRLPLMEDLVSLQASWTLTCEVLSDTDNYNLTWLWNGEETLPENTKNTTDSEGNYVIKARNSTWEDAGQYTCALDYPDGTYSHVNVSVDIRLATTDMESVFYTTFTPTSMSCEVESGDTPTGVTWSKPSNGDEQGTLSYLGENAWSSTYTTPASSLTDEAGTYTCTFTYDDSTNPALSFVLQYADLQLTSGATVAVEDGDVLELEGFLYSSNWQKYTLAWYKDGTVLKARNGYIQVITRHETDNYTISLTKDDCSSEQSGNYSAVFTAKGYAITLVSDPVEVSVLDSAETVETTSDGGPLNLTCTYSGDVEPAQVTWLWEGSALNTTKWTVDMEAYSETDETQTTIAMTDSMKPADGGTYHCIFTVNSINITHTNEVTIRTLKQEDSGEVTITTEDWSMTVTVGSTEEPKYAYLHLAGTDTKVYNSITGPTSAGVNSHVYTVEADTTGGSDGTWRVVVMFRDGGNVTSEPVTIKTRRVFTTDTDTQTFTLTSDSSNSDYFYFTCSYIGGEAPETAFWRRDDGTEFEGTGYKSSSRSGTYNTYTRAKTGLRISDLTVEDGGVYTCVFNFTDGTNASLALPRVSIAESLDIDQCKVLTNGNVTISCRYRTEETLTSVRWADEDGNTVASNNTDMVLGEVSEGGRYYCYGTTSYNEQFSAFTDVTAAKIALSVDPDEPYLGSYVTVACESSGFYTAVKMLHDDSIVTTSDSNSVYSTSFTLTSSTGGNYSCSARMTDSCGDTHVITGYTSDEETYLTLTADLPEVLVQPGNVTASQGTTAYLTCEVPQLSDNAPNKVVWQQQGDDATTWGQKTLLSNDTVLRSVLKKKSVDTDDTGKYRCLASYYGEILKSKWGRLTVSGFTVNPAYSTMGGVVGGNATISCSYLGEQGSVMSLMTGKGDTSGVVYEVTESPVDGSHFYRYNYTFTIPNLTEDNEGKYWCAVGSVTSTRTNLDSVVTIKDQPSNATVVVGDPATFTLITSRFTYENYVVTWQSWDVESGSWISVNETDNIKIYDMSAGRWKTWVNILEVSDDTPSIWRAVVEFPAEDGLMSGVIVSDAAYLEFYGSGFVTLKTGDSFEGDTFTFVCSAHVPEEVEVKLYMAGYRVDNNIWSSVIEEVFSEETMNVTVEKTLESWYAGQEVECKIPSYDLSWSTTFPDTIYQDCSSLSSRDYGSISYADVTDGQTATLTCEEDNDYYPYEKDKSIVFCDYLTGFWNETMTTCVLVQQIDYSMLKVGIFFSGYLGCLPARYQSALLAILMTEGGFTCGWAGTTMNMLCLYDDPSMCTFQVNDTSCEVMYRTTSSGKVKKGSEIAGYFQYTGTVNFATGSDYMTYADDVEDGASRYSSGGTTFRSNFWTCTADSSKRRRRRAAGESDDFQAELDKLINWNDTEIEVVHYPVFPGDVDDGKDLVPANEEPDQVVTEKPDQVVTEKPDQVVTEKPDRVITKKPPDLKEEQPDLPLDLPETHSPTAGPARKENSKSSTITNWIIGVAAASVLVVGVAFSWCVLKNRQTTPDVELIVTPTEMTLIQ